MIVKERINENLIITGADLTAWFEAKIKKYPHSALRDHLELIYSVLSEEPTFGNDGIETFLKEKNK